MAIIRYSYDVQVTKIVEFEIPDSVVEEAVDLAIKDDTVSCRNEFFDNPDIVQEYIDIYGYGNHEEVDSIEEDNDPRIYDIFELDVELSFDEFDEQYEIEDNPFNEDSQMLTLDEEGEKEYLNSKNENHIWTVIYDDDETYIVPGIRVVNKVGFYITNKPWQNPNIIVSEE